MPRTGQILKSMHLVNPHTVELEYVDSEINNCEGVKRMNKSLDKVAHGRILKRLLIFNKHTEISKQCRAMLVKENMLRRNKISAEAIVVHSFSQKLSMLFYSIFLQNTYPVRLFTDREQAEEWLEQFNGQTA